MSADEGLKREIGVWGLTANSINIIIGAGIFILPVIVAERLGTGSIWAYLVCGVMMIMIMLCFAEVGTMIIRTGGAYSYIEEAFGKYAGFLTTNIFIFGAAVMANAAVANGLADTLSYFIPFFRLQLVRLIFFGLMFGGFAYLNVIGIRQAIVMVKFTTIAKLTPVLMIALLGWFFVSPENLTHSAGNSAPDLGGISLILIFAFVGAETAMNVSGEIREPGKTIPRGIMLSMLVVVVLYALIQLTVQGILGQSISNFRDAPLAEAAKRMAGPAGASLVIIGAVFSMFGNISGMVLNMPRVLFAASRDNVLPPKALSKIHPRFSTPHISIITYAALGFLFASMGEFRQLAILSSASYLIIYLGVVLSVIKFRISGQYSEGTYKVPGGYTIPGIAVLSILWLLSNIPSNELRAMIIFILLLTVIFFTINIVQRFKDRS